MREMGRELSNRNVSMKKCYEEIEELKTMGKSKDMEIAELRNQNMTKSSTDFISFSPSLFHILQYVEHKDIVNCQLVNRRISHVIRNGLHSLPRRKVELFLEIVKIPPIKDVARFIAWSVPERRSVLSLWVTDEWTFVGEDLLGLETHYNNNGSVAVACAQTEESEQTKVLANAYYLSFKDVRCYRNDCIEGGIRSFLSFVVGKFYLNIFHIYKNLPEVWAMNMIQVFRETRPKCRFLSLQERISDVEGLVKSLGCDEVALEIGAKTSFIRDMNDIVRWNREHFITFRIDTSKVIDGISTLIQNWQNGTFSFNKLQLQHCVGRKWPRGSLNRFVYGLKDAVVGPVITGRRYSVHFRDVEVFVERAVDNKVLIITFALRHRCISSINEHPISM